MAAPQDPPRRLWQKKRRTKKLALWRAKKAAAEGKTGVVAEVKATAKKAIKAVKEVAKAATGAGDKKPADKKPAAKKPAK